MWINVMNAFKLKNNNTRTTSIDMVVASLLTLHIFAKTKLPINLLFLLTAMNIYVPAWVLHNANFLIILRTVGKKIK